MTKLISLLLGKIKMEFDQAFTTPGALSHAKVVIQYLVAADDVDTKDLEAVISLIFKALDKTQKEWGQAHFSAVDKENPEIQEKKQEELKASYNRVVNFLKGQVKVVTARIEELHSGPTITTENLEIINSSVVETVGGNGIPFGPQPKRPITDSITFPD
jgi:hypothetical protein